MILARAFALPKDQEGEKQLIIWTFNNFTHNKQLQ